MKILITGSAGTLGGPLLEALCQKGHVVIGCDLAHSPDPRIIRCDVRQFHRLQDIFDKHQPEIVMHLAAEFGRANGQTYWEDLWTTNCIGTRNVIECCKVHNSFLVFASSSEAYGSLSENGPLYEALLDCAMPQFYNEYALSKLTNEKQIQLSGVRHLILRIFNVYGPGEHYTPYRSVISQFLNAALLKKNFAAWQGQRSYLYIDDFIAAICRIPEKTTELEGEIINCADEEIIENHFLASLCANDSGKYELLPFHESRNVTTKKPDIAKFKELLGYKKTVSLEEGLERTAEWMRLYD